MPSAGMCAARFPLVLATEFAACLRYTVGARFSASAVGALKEPKGSLDTLLLMTKIPASLAEVAALNLTLIISFANQDKEQRVPVETGDGGISPRLSCNQDDMIAGAT